MYLTGKKKELKRTFEESELFFVFAVIVMPGGLSWFKAEKILVMFSEKNKQTSISLILAPEDVM